MAAISGRLIARIHGAHGVELRAGDQVAAFAGAERIEAIVTASGHRVACDFAVAGIGIDPEVPAITGSSIAQENGILADELCRTSAADVYVAGDVANPLHPLFGRVRVEHFNNAEKQGAAAARSMLGSVAPDDSCCSASRSHRYEHKIECVGPCRPVGRVRPSRGRADEIKLPSVFTWWTGSFEPPSGWTGAAIPSWMRATARWQPARAWSPSEPSRLPGVLADEHTDL